MRYGLTILGAILLLAAPAAAVPMGLFVLEEESSITLQQGGSTPLSGALTINVGSLPPPGATPFDVVALSITSGTNLQIGLDPEVPSPGLGVLDDQGGFLIPTLFLTVSSPTVDSFDLALQNVTGTATWEGSALTRIDSSFQIEGPLLGTATVTVAAVVPEPSTLWLLCAGLFVLALATHPRQVRFAGFQHQRGRVLR